MYGACYTIAIVWKADSYILKTKTSTERAEEKNKELCRQMNKTVVIAGSGRSGTTWVQDTLAEANGLRTLFEPLNPAGVPVARKFAYRYLGADVDDCELELFLGDVFSGAHRSLWANYRIRPSRLNLFKVGVSPAIHNVHKLARHYYKYRLRRQSGVIVKFIRANLMLPWIVRQFHVPLLFVTRHPCAVIASRLRLGGSVWVSQQELDRYRSAQDVVQLVLDEFDVDIKAPFSNVSALACVWCIENLLPIKWAAGSGFMVTAYEKLLAESDREWERVIHGLGLSHLPGSALLKAPSQQVSPEMRGNAFSASYLGKWRETLSVDQISEISSTLDRFSCSVYTVDGDLPREI